MIHRRYLNPYYGNIQELPPGSRPGVSDMHLLRHTRQHQKDQRATADSEDTAAESVVVYTTPETRRIRLLLRRFLSRTDWKQETAKHFDSNGNALRRFPSN